MRQPTPWFRASKHAWFVEHHGKQVRLGIHPVNTSTPKKSPTGWNPPKAILDAYYKLMATECLPQSDKLAVSLMCDLFLEHGQKHHTADTYENYLYFLQSFCNAHGSLPVTEIRPFHVTKWLYNNPAWKGGRRHAVIAVKRAFSWADQEGIFSPSPIRGIKAEGVKRRTRVLSSEEQTEILATIRDKEFRQFVRAMLATGCRPSEVSRVTAANVNLDLGVWIFEIHKTAKKTQKPRVVYLSEEMAALTRELMAKNPEGPLFRSSRRNAPFTRNAIRIRFGRLRKKLPHLKYLVAYSARHSFATQALVNGVGIAQVAELLGHTSSEMVSSTYGHLAGQIARMREAAKKATASGTATNDKCGSSGKCVPGRLTKRRSMPFHEG
ncbi:tyrosine-type recombinase/integrase [Zavarzinella formosa]|uniref:tyrosine-type recombinase/integrase n=1 Tax=Zavarzinella formosa TaxID=360055 RepID=UPI0002EAC570|nr:site-specific integrase [Zavarzinella formosa]